MSAPVRHTCPDIDKVISSIRRAIKSAESAQKVCEDDTVNGYLSYIIYEIGDLEWKLEDLRSDNSALRDWGHGLEEEIKELNELLEEQAVDQ